MTIKNTNAKVKRIQTAFRIVDEVKSMRKLQRKYFKTRDRDVLSKAKAQERKIDTMIKEFDDRQHRLNLGLPD